MAIQNSVNQMLGSVAGAIATGTYLRDQQKQNELRDINEGEQLNKESSEIINKAKELQESNISIEEGILATQEEIDEAEAGNVDYYRNKKTGRFMSKNDYITERELAIQELENRQNAIQIQRADLANRIEFYNKRVDATNAIKKGIAPNLEEKLPDEKYKSAVRWVKGGNK